MKTFEEILQDMLDAVPDDLDKREGGVIYTALAPVSAQLAELYFYADNLIDASMPDTGRGDGLTRICGIYGINRYPATKAIRKAVFLDADGASMDVAIGARFGAAELTYRVTASGQVTCEQAGAAGNRYFGELIPIDHISGLGSATLADILVAGEDMETDDALRERFYSAANSEPFGGNVAQYEELLLGISGVGAVKVFPTPDGHGGLVQCIVTNPDKGPVSGTLLTQIQETIDPLPGGKGYGQAPIGHTVTISTVTETAIHVKSIVTLKPGTALSTVQEAAKQAISSYLREIAFSDPVVRISRIDAALVQISGVADITGTTLNGGAVNITLPDEWNDYQVPVLGTVNFTEANA